MLTSRVLLAFGDDVLQAVADTDGQERGDETLGYMVENPSRDTSDTQIDGLMSKVYNRVHQLRSHTLSHAPAIEVTRPCIGHVGQVRTRNDTSPHSAQPITSPTAPRKVPSNPIACLGSKDYDKNENEFSLGPASHSS